MIPVRCGVNRNFEERKDPFFFLFSQASADELAQFPAMLAELVMSFEAEIETGALTDVLSSVS